MTVRVPLPGRDASSEIVIAPGLLHELPLLLAHHCPAVAYAVIADENVAPGYAAPLVDRITARGVRAQLFTFPAGERAKTRATWGDLTDAMLAARFGRDAAVVAVGGGVTGDLAGFVAATYLRGIPLVHAPTSLLAMVDAAVGGKTGVDVPAGKNLVGAFHQPRLVACDLATLATLPADPFAGGMAEALKHGAIADADYFESIAAAVAPLRARDTTVLERLVSRSVEIKAMIVAADEREAGRRAALNFGHTVAHAIEAASRWSVAHGPAVAAGMVVEARLGEALGVTAAGTAQRLTQILPHFGLPTALPVGLPAPTLLAAMAVDKKVRAGVVHFTLLERIGAVHQPNPAVWTIAVQPRDVSAALQTTIGS